MNDPLAHPRIKGKACQLLIALIPLILIIIGTLWLVYFQFNENVSEQNEHLAELLLIKSKRVFSYVDKSNMGALSDLGNPCSHEQSETLQNLAGEGLYLRSISFFKNSFIYCSSVPEILNMPIRTVENFVDGKLLLFTDDYITKGVPLIAVRIDRDNLGIVSVIDGRYLQTILEENSLNTKLMTYIKIGDRWMSNSGGTSAKEIPELMRPVQLKIGRFPAYIIVGHTPEFDVAEIWSSYWLVLISGLLMAGVLSVVIYQYISTPVPIYKILKKALKNNEFVPYLQGVVDPEGNLRGAEVLMRWKRASGELVRPDIFIPEAEKHGLIIKMTSSLFEALKVYVQNNIDKLPHGFCLNINISKDHFSDSNLVNDCKKFLSDIPKGRIILCLEITERELIEYSEESAVLMKELNALGVKVAIDDFGTGHATFHYLQKFQIDQIKIDRSFVKNIGVDSISALLVDIIIDLGHRMGVEVVAEGVETSSQAEYLSERKVTKIQGFYYYKPVSLSHFSESLAITSQDK